MKIKPHKINEKKATQQRKTLNTKMGKITNVKHSTKTEKNCKSGYIWLNTTAQTETKTETEANTHCVYKSI